MKKATQDLRKEHDAILYVLQILDKAMNADSNEDKVLFKFYEDLVYFLRIFADKCHHGKEENHLFEELIKAEVPNEGGPIGVMLEEHVQGREYISQMNQALETKDIKRFNSAALKYRDLLQNHIGKENNVLFMLADQLLDEAKQEELFAKFEEHEEQVIGHGVHDQLHSMIHRWAAEFEVN